MAVLNDKDLEQIFGGMKQDLLPQNIEIDEELLNRYLNGEITPEELRELINKK